MTFNEYEKYAKESLAKYVRDKSQEDRYLEFILGLYEEAAEVTAPIRKTIKGNFHESEIDLINLQEEIGDVLWYISQIASELPDSNLEKIAIKNIKKIQQEKEGTETDITINEYSKKTKKAYRQDIPKSKAEKARFFCLGLIKEIGKLAEMFGENRINSKNLNTEKIEEKLGDSLWYLSAICEIYGLDLEKIAVKNIQKVHGRYKVSDGTVIKQDDEER